MTDDQPHLERWHRCATEGLQMTGINKEYVPRTAIVRGYYATAAAFGGDVVDSALQFNRWLHAHDAEIRAAALAGSERDLAKAWRDGCDAGFEYGYVKGSTDPDFVDATDAPTNPHTTNA